MAVNVQVICPSVEMHREDQSHQPEVVVAMQVTDENVTDPMNVRLVPHQLHLSPFATVDKERSVLYFN